MEQIKQIIAESGCYLTKQFRDVIDENKWYYDLAKHNIDITITKEASKSSYVTNQLKQYDNLLQKNIFFIYGLRCGLNDNDKTIGAIVTELNRKPAIEIKTSQQMVDAVFDLIIGGNIAFVIGYLYSLNGKEFNGYDTESLITKWVLASVKDNSIAIEQTSAPVENKSAETGPDNTKIEAGEKDEQKEFDENLMDGIMEDRLRRVLNLKDESITQIKEAFAPYFATGKFEKAQKINVGRINKKELGWALSRIFFDHSENQAQRKGLSYEYLQFAKEHISIFANDSLEKSEPYKGLLYKNFTQKPYKY